MTFNNDVVQAIGNTPLIKLKQASELTGCTILGKAEFMNPGQSVKDRAARQMILEAEARGEIRPGGLVVESTAGNTGIGLALVANARGYRTLIVIPVFVSPVAMGLVWRFIFEPTSGLANWLLHLVHLPGSLWLSSTRTSLVVRQ